MEESVWVNGERLAWTQAWLTDRPSPQTGPGPQAGPGPQVGTGPQARPAYRHARPTGMAVYRQAHRPGLQAGP